MLNNYTETIYINGQQPSIDDTNLNNNENQTKLITLEVQSQETKISNLETPTQTDYIPSNNIPYSEGTVFYDSSRKTLSVYNDIPEMTLNLGQENIVRVYNNTGITIPNGKPVKLDGYITNGVPNISLSQADTFGNSRCLGVTTHDISNGQEGFVTILGSVQDIDLRSYSIGDMLYLSESVLGGLTVIPPKIATFVGIVLDNSINGKLLSNPKALVVLPTIYSILQDGSTISNVSANIYQNFTNYTQSNNLGMTSNATNGSIHLEHLGAYRISLNIVANFDTIGNAKEDLFIALFDVNDLANPIKEIKDFLGKDSEAGSFYPSFMVDITSGTELVIGIKCTTNLNNISYSAMTFDIQSINII